MKITQSSKVPVSVDGELLDKPQFDFYRRILKDTCKLLEMPKDKRDGCWLSYPKKYLVNFGGGNYRRLVIDPLIRAGYIEVLRNQNSGRESYWCNSKRDGKNSDGPIEPYCKRYRIPYRYILELLRGQVTVVTRSRKMSFEKLIRQVEWMTDKTDLHDAACRKTKENIEKLDSISHRRLAEELQELNRSLGKVIDIELCVRRCLMINVGLANASRGKNSGRIYSTANHCGSKHLIPFFRVAGERVAEIDAKSLHICLLPHLVDDREAQTKFLDFLDNNDPYLYFVDAAITDPEERKAKRDRMKTAWQKALAHSVYKCPEARLVLNFLAEHHPLIYQVIKNFKDAKKINRGNNIQRRLQQIEAGIMNEAFLLADFWCLTRHDSMVVKASDVTRACDLLLSISRKILGYDLKLSSK